MTAPTPDPAFSDPYTSPTAAPSLGDTKPPWNPKAIGFITFFFSFLPGGIMLALNYERLGQPEKKMPTLLAVIVGFVVFMTIIFMLPEESAFDRLFHWLNIAIAVTFGNLQKGTFESYMADGGTKASPWPAAGLSFMGVVAIVVAFGAWAFWDVSRDEARFETARTHMQAGEYDQAEAIFLEYAEKYPEEAGTYFNLASIYLSQGRLEEARKYAAEYHRLVPDDPEGEALMNRILSAAR